MSQPGIEPVHIRFLDDRDLHVRQAVQGDGKSRKLKGERFAGTLIALEPRLDILIEVL